MTDLKGISRKKITKQFSLDPRVVETIRILADKEDATYTAVVEYCVNTVYKQLTEEV